MWRRHGDQRHVAHLASTQRDRAAAEVTALAEAAYRSGGSWSRADLDPLMAFARTAELGIKVYDANGVLLGSAAAPGATGSNPPILVESSVVADGRRIGTVAVDFPFSGNRPGDSHLRSSLSAAVGWSAALASVAALVVALLLARGVVRPLRRLVSVVGSLELGGHSREWVRPLVRGNWGSSEEPLTQWPTRSRRRTGCDAPLSLTWRTS